MPKISSYSTTAPALTDKLIGTDANDNSATKNFTVGDVLGLSQGLVLNSFNTVAQPIASVSTSQQVVFGSAVANDSVSLAANGSITFLKAGRYIVETRFNGGQISSSGVNATFNIFYASKLNGAQIGNTIEDSVRITTGTSNFFDTTMNTFVLSVNSNDVLTFEFKSGLAGSGLGVSTTSGFSDIPSSVIKINKV
jgi:hypothetical protein